MKTTILPGQTLSDLAIQEYGAEEAVLDLAMENGISPTGIPEDGTALNCPDTEYDEVMKNYCKNHDVLPATKESADSEIRLRIFTEQFTRQFS